MAFPSNQFGSQEPNEVEKVRKDMKSQFNVDFPIFDKIDVNGPNTSALYAKLKSMDNINTSAVQKISWNFEKFLIDADGVPVRRYKPGVKPLALESDISTLINTGTLPLRKKPSLNNYSD